MNNLVNGDEYIKMTDISNLCMVCLGAKDENGICSVCRQAEDIIQKSPLLPLKSVIAQRYIIAKAHKRNSEGITYAAYDTKLEKSVSVREFYPDAFCERDIDLISVLPKAGTSEAYERYLNSFISLWTKLMRLKGITALITVTDVFRLNGTAYAVYDESERVTLRDYLLETKEGFIPWDKSRILFMPVLSTIGTLHTSGIFHRGINPQSFIFSKDGKLKLTDFCIEAVRSPAGALESEIFEGYAPIEQYSLNKPADARTDIYSFCSVIYRSLIGTTPIDAKTRAENDRMMIPAKFAEQLPPYVINALINGMAVEPDDRTDNIEQLRCDLSASPRAIGASAPSYSPEKEIPSQQETKNIFIEPLSDEPAKIQQSPKKSPAVTTEAYTSSASSKKKNALIAVLCVILAILVLGIGILAGEIVKLSGGRREEQTTVSGSSIVQVPSFVGGYISDIITNPQYTEYFVFKTVTENSSTVMAGVVINQNIPENAQATKGETIILTVSSGPRSFQLDDVSGWTYEQANAHFTSLGLVCQQSQIHNDGTHVGGVIAETIPAAESVVKQGDIITIVTYTSPDEENSSENQNMSGNSVEDFLQSLNPSESTTAAQAPVQ